MTSKTWVPGTVIDSPWLQDVNDITYGLPSNATGKGASLVAVQDAANWFSAVVTKTVESVLGFVGGWLWGRDVNIFQYLSVAQISDVKAYTYSVDCSAAVQAALEAAFSSGRNCFAPAGGYLVSSGFYIPSLSNGVTDERNKGFTFYGQGNGVPFTTAGTKPTGGTCFWRSGANAPTVMTETGTTVGTNGQLTVKGMRFDGNCTTAPVILIQTGTYQNVWEDVTAYQQGDGDGWSITYAAATEFKRCLGYNKHLFAPPGTTRTGTGFKYINNHSSGLVTFDLCSTRGWLQGYELNGSSGGSTIISTTLTRSECSLVSNGVLVKGANKCVLDTVYVEGGDGGIGIDNQGDGTSINRCFVFPGFLTAIKDTLTSNYGSSITENVISLGATVNAVGIDVVSSSAFGGNSKNVENNAVLFTDGTIGVTGIRVAGTDPRISVSKNHFSPRAAWTGAGSNKLVDNSTNGVQGIISKSTGSREVTVVSRGAMFLQQSATILSATDVSGNTLTLPDECSFFVFTPAGAVNINTVIGSVTPGRVITFRLTNNLVTFTNSAFIKMPAGAAFTGGANGGLVSGILDRSGANNIFYVQSAVQFP